MSFNPNMPLPTEPIGSVPRPESLVQLLIAHTAGQASEAEVKSAQQEALRETIREMEETGSPVISDGEQTKPSFATYPLAGLTNLTPDGAVIPFADGHTRQLPALSRGPFHYANYAAEYLKAARQLTERPLKQAVISASAMSLLYPASGIPGYSQEQLA